MQSFNVIDDYVLPHTPPPTPVCGVDDTPDDFADISFLFETNSFESTTHLHFEMIDTSIDTPPIPDVASAASVVAEGKPPTQKISEPTVPNIIIDQSQTLHVPIVTSVSIIKQSPQTCYCIFCNSND
jgi:hypothetical protein